MTDSRFGRSHVVAGAFVFLLLGVFAVFSTVMVLLSAQLYRTTVEDTQVHAAQRVAGNYLLNIVHGNDAADSVRVEEADGMPVLVLGTEYETRVYCYEGQLRELFMSAEDEFTPEYGESICAAQAFEPVLSDGLLTMTFTAENGQESMLYAALRTAAKEAQP